MLRTNNYGPRLATVDDKSADERVLTSTRAAAIRHICDIIRTCRVDPCDDAVCSRGVSIAVRLNPGRGIRIDVRGTVIQVSAYTLREGGRVEVKKLIDISVVPVPDMMVRRVVVDIIVG